MEKCSVTGLKELIPMVVMKASVVKELQYKLR